MIRKNLNCKPFDYFLEVVMPDMLERYPYSNPGIFASGAIQSQADKSLCIDSLRKPNGAPLELYKCNRNLVKPERPQMFTLSWHRQIKKFGLYDYCLDLHQTSMWGCHFALGHQMWKFDIVSCYLSYRRASLIE